MAASDALKAIGWMTYDLHFFRYLDPQSAKQFRLTCHTAADLYASFGHGAQGSPKVFPTLPSASSNNVHVESSSDDEMTPTSEEDDWQFQITPEITRRLSLIPKRSTGPSLASLPAELQLEVFSYLDKIDSCCLGLTSPNLYVVFRAINGTKMPLNTRRVGPNSLESAWEIVGKQECRQCGVYRCELHEHIKTWMPGSLEYCAMKQNFGRPARDGSKATCYRGKPSKPRRCGRHPQRTTTTHQDDATFDMSNVDGAH